MWIVRKRDVTFINAKMSEPAGFVIKKNWEITDQFWAFNWDLVSVEFQEANKDKGIYAGIKINLVDDGQEYVINTGISTTIAMLLSSMTRLEGKTLNNVWFALSTYKDFPSFSVFADDGTNKPLRWNHDVKEVSAKVTNVVDWDGNDIINDSGYPIKNNSKLIEFMKELIEEINGKIKSDGGGDILADVEHAENNPVVAEKTKAADLEDSDLPF